MIFEVEDQGRLERLGVVNSDVDKSIDGRKYIGGYRLNTSGYESVWFDKSVWNIETLSKDDGIPVYRLTRKAS